jgi:hypothetical protein
VLQATLLSLIEQFVVYFQYPNFHQHKVLVRKDFVATKDAHEKMVEKTGHDARLIHLFEQVDFVAIGDEM